MNLVPSESFIPVADVYQALCQVLEGRQQIGDRTSVLQEPAIQRRWAEGGRGGESRKPWWQQVVAPPAEDPWRKGEGAQVGVGRFSFVLRLGAELVCHRVVCHHVAICEASPTRAPVWSVHWHH